MARLLYRCAEVPRLILSDRQRLVQVLLNLLTNAMKYTVGALNRMYELL
jgi:signal transduction histidine kinase